MKHYIYIVLGLIFIFFLGNCSTEEYAAIVGKIEGTVINDKTKEPVENCEIISQHLGVSFSDSHGKFSFSDVEAGTIQLTYKCSGYQTVTREFTVSAGKTVQANVSLVPMEEESKLLPNNTILDFGNREGVIDLILKNTSNSSIVYSIKCDAQEISFDPQRGTIIGGNSSIIKVSVNRTDISEGHYERTATIITEGSTIDLQIIFDKGVASRPTVSTLALDQSEDQSNTIIAKGAIISVGSSNIIQHGFCYSTDSDPSLTSNEGIINRGSVNAATNYSATITNLEYEKTYNVRAFATNQQGTSYGDVISIVLNHIDNISIETQDATTITPTSARLNVKISGGVVSNLSEIGFYYGTTAKCEKKIVVDARDYQTASNISVVINDLKSDTDYFFKAYGITSSGEKMGEVKSFKTLKAATDDTQIICETGNASNITVNSAIIHGSFTVNGALKIKEWGFYYGSNTNPSVKNACRTYSAGISITQEAMSAKLEKLEEDKEYYFQSYVIDESDNIIKGAINSFRTLAEVKCETLEVSEISTTSAILKGMITSGEISSISQYGFYYGTTSNCSQKCLDVKTSSDGSSFEAKILNLETDKDYFYKAFCITPSGEKFGEVKSFHTIKENPTGSVLCVTDEASDITTNSAVIHGNFTVSGALKVKEWGFYYGTTANPSIRSVCETNSNPITITAKTISQKILKLSESTTYYYQTYAIDELNNVFRGPVVSFTTLRTPTIVIDYLTVSNSMGLTGKATLYPEGNTVLEAGFLYRTDGYDISLTSNYNGKTVNVPCEIVNNTITLNTESIGGYLGGGYVRAYMLLVDGTIIYNGSKIYVAADLPYPRP